jgi:SAM-dependent methyltransferase
MFGVLHEDRSRAESFGSVAELYDRVRPSYPPALLDHLLAGSVVGVLDVGCGTGIAAAMFAARGATVLGVEIDERMAARARAKGVAVEVAPFERWDDAGRRFDLVVSGQAWHWVEPQAGAAKAARVLRPGGRIGLFWNLGGPPDEVRERLAPVYDRLEPGLENHSVVLGNRSGRDRETVAGLVNSGLFGEVTVSRFPWRESYDPATWIEFLQTHSDHHTLPGARRRRLVYAIAEALDGLASFEVAYETVLVSASRRSVPGGGSVRPAAGKAD